VDPDSRQVRPVALADVTRNRVQSDAWAI